MDPALLRLECGCCGESVNYIRVTEDTEDSRRTNAKYARHEIFQQTIDYQSVQTADTATSPVCGPASASIRIAGLFGRPPGPELGPVRGNSVAGGSSAIRRQIEARDQR